MADGSKYVGEFKDGSKHGLGSLTMADGSKYVGEVKDNKPWNGIGYNANGKIVGTFSAGRWCDNCSPNKGQLALVDEITQAASSSDSVVWCATKYFYRKQKESICKVQRGKSYSSEYQAKAEHNRLYKTMLNKQTPSTSTASGDDKVWCATPTNYWLTDQARCDSQDGKVFDSKHLAIAEYNRLKGSSSSSTSVVAYCYNSSRNLLYRNITSCGNQGREISRNKFKEVVATKRRKLSNSHSISCLDEDGDLYRKPSSGCYDPDVEVSAQIACFYSLRNVDKKFVGSDTQYLRNAVLDCSSDNKIIGWKIGSKLPTTSIVVSSSKVWCATKHGVIEYDKAGCIKEGHKAYSSKSLAEAEHRRLAGKSYSSNTNTTKKKKKGLLSGLKNLFSGSPFVTVQMSASELRGISDKQLCNTYRMEGFYSGKTPPIINEVNRRGLDCYGAKGKCRAYGFKEGTSGFAGCVMQTEMQLVEEQRKQNKATIDNAISNLNPPAPAPVVICRNTWVYDVHGRQQRIEQCN